MQYIYSYKGIKQRRTRKHWGGGGGKYTPHARNASFPDSAFSFLITAGTKHLLIPD